MSFIKAFVSKHIQAAVSTPPNGMESVALFFYGAAPTHEAIAALASGAEVSSTHTDGKTRITVAWPDVNTVITIDPSWDKVTQMEGMRGWAERFPQRVRELEEVKALIASFETVNACYGTVSRPGLDTDNKVINLLKAMLGEPESGGGFFFSRNSFYGLDGLRITGFNEDPVWLGTPPQS
jgi:hypothetical protein